MASALLTVLYPEEFTVYDQRVRGQLEMDDFAYNNDVVERYFNEYIESVKKKVKDLGFSLSLRDCDRLLWGKSWYEDMYKFLKN